MLDYNIELIVGILYSLVSVHNIYIYHAIHVIILLLYNAVRNVKIMGMMRKAQKKVYVCGM